ncbi:hypothetical protein PAXRUDRAFT_821589 [Paxillus rubicundulus Ve08.2h10]|uniref:Uncharacterized protein n=1 Tax=Paxillus rubicundulus Ve08.2h10 TaxID=930991 RepID=A0A0D0EAN7_9AGAM|nr:hypothetical protein PAXRUDRAFT_821589 [Paxillus rubicundulus Ve08.2h10]
MSDDPQVLFDGSSTQFGLEPGGSSVTSPPEQEEFDYHAEEQSVLPPVEPVCFV